MRTVLDFQGFLDYLILEGNYGDFLEKWISGDVGIGRLGRLGGLVRLG